MRKKKKHKQKISTYMYRLFTCMILEQEQHRKEKKVVVYEYNIYHWG
jgi:hypothetical protein